MSVTVETARPVILVVAMASSLIAKEVALNLLEDDFPRDGIEMVVFRDGEDVSVTYKEINTKSTSGSMISASLKWGLLGFALGGLGGLVMGMATSSVLIGIGMPLIGGLTAIIYGAVAGVDNATIDDSVDLPTANDYRTLLQNGGALLVLRGNEHELTRARDCMTADRLSVSNLLTVRGHTYHQHSDWKSNCLGRVIKFT